MKGSEKFLRAVYKLSNANLRGGAYFRELESLLEITPEESNNLYFYLKEKGFVRRIYQNRVTITAPGIDEVEKNMANEYADKELLVLKTIYEMGKGNPRNEVLYIDFIEKLGVIDFNLNDILTELYDRKRYLSNSSDETLKVSPAGMEFLEGKSNMKDKNNIHNVTHINAPIGNLQQFTHNSSQSFAQIHAPSSVPDDLAGQISLLREELKKMARAEEDAGHDTSDYDEAIGVVTSARKALTEGDESKAKSYLLTSGKFVADFASKIGVNLITELIKQQSGL